MHVQGTYTFAVIAFGAVMIMLHAALCAYAATFPQDVATQLRSPVRSYLAWAFLLALRIGRYDAELDLQPALPVQSITANCRRRGIMGLTLSLVSFALLIFFFVIFPTFHK